MKTPTKKQIRKSKPDVKEIQNEKVEKPSVIKVKVSIDNLNIRKGPGKNYEKTGEFTGKGIFEITEKKDGIGSPVGWGKLKSDKGWISLYFCEEVK